MDDMYSKSMQSEKHAILFRYFGEIPSVNHIYGTMKNGRKFLKKEVKVFRDSLKYLAIDAMNRTKMIKIPKGLDVGIVIYVDFANSKRRDIDNIPKAIFDAMNGIAFEDDSQISTFTVSKVKSGSPEPYLSILIYNVEKGAK